jgi:inorganic pyrophosphatase
VDRLDPFEGDCLVVVIETPKGSANKLKFEPRYGAFALKSVLPAGAIFPFDFGFVPSTCAEDGDPLDVLVLMDAPVFPGCVVRSRLIGVLEAVQIEDGKKERNDRLIAVAHESSTHGSIRKLTDLGRTVLDQIEHFFVSYNEARGKPFTIKRRAGKKQAMALVKAAMTKHSSRSSQAAGRAANS